MSYYWRSLVECMQSTARHGTISAWTVCAPHRRQGSQQQHKTRQLNREKNRCSSVQKHTKAQLPSSKRWTEASASGISFRNQVIPEENPNSQKQQQQREYHRPSTPGLPVLPQRVCLCVRVNMFEWKEFQNPYWALKAFVSYSFCENM